MEAIFAQLERVNPQARQVWIHPERHNRLIDDGLLLFVQLRQTSLKRRREIQLDSRHGLRDASPAVTDGRHFGRAA